jgi:isoamylase
MVDVRVHSPGAIRVEVRVLGGATVPLERDGSGWLGSVQADDRYQIVIDDGPGLVDPYATEVWFGPAHTRDRHDAWAVAAAWPEPRPQRPTSRPLIVSEAHVRGMTKLRDRSDAGTYAAFTGELSRLASLGVSVVELLPVHQFDPAEPNYWGYMPLAFGAVHRSYAHTAAPAAELADFVSEAHDVDIEVWLDVVLNHTTEEDREGPTYNLRGLADREYYVVNDDGSYVNDAGCGNIIDAASPVAQELLLTSLDRLADLGVDGFRFDLAAVLARNPAFIRSIGDWAERRGVRLIAEPWDLTRYLAGRDFPDARWAQWNGKFRDDLRGFLRGEGGLVGKVLQRVQGSPDLFDTPGSSINMLTAHDGFTLYDLFAYDRKHNGANGWNGTDGTDDNRSWNCGWEGDIDAPHDVLVLRRRQMRNAMCLLMLSQGTPMIVAGDEFARTQHGNNNPYNQDNETSWIDWERRDAFVDHERFVQRLIAFRVQRHALTQPEPWGSAVEWFGVAGGPDLGSHSRSIAWHIGDLYVMANMWWEPLDFAVQVPGSWRIALDTTDEQGFIGPGKAVGGSLRVGPRSVVVLTGPD